MSEKLEILEMLNQGTITVEEANRLLEAVQDDTPPTTKSETDSPPPAAPNLQRFRHLSYIPFGVFVLLLVLAAWGTYALSRRADGQITAGFVAMLVVLVLCSLLTWFTFAMTRMPWLHVRVRSKSGQTPEGKASYKRFIISLPVPLALAQWGLRIAPRYVSEEQAAQVEMAASVLQSVRHDLGKPGTDPIAIDVDDNDERVQIYFG
jgi:cytochrome bd-type quinol oxidase subunit 1